MGGAGSTTGSETVATDFEVLVLGCVEEARRDFVADIVDAYGGRLDLADASPGLRVEIVMPRRA
jgi:hypothetical protein